jgi:hypothetical protein
MKILIVLFLIIVRFWIGFKILTWIVLKATKPFIHEISEIELYLVIMIFDVWISSTHNDIDVKVIKNED